MHDNREPYSVFASYYRTLLNRRSHATSIAQPLGELLTSAQNRLLAPLAHKDISMTNGSPRICIAVRSPHLVFGYRPDGLVVKRFTNHQFRGHAFDRGPSFPGPEFLGPFVKPV